MYDKNWGNLLKLFQNITKSKSKELSNCTSYDPSYISKWIHNKSLPSKDEISYIIESLTKLFSTRIVSLSAENQLNSLLRRPVILNEYTIPIVISNMLYASYYDSAHFTLRDIQQDVFFIKEPINVFKESVTYINKQIILNPAKRLDIYVALNILEMCEKAQIDSFLYFSENVSSIKLNLMLRKEHFRFWKEKKNSYISILFSLFLYNVDVYLDCQSFIDNYIYFVDRGLMSYKFNSSGYAYYMDIVHDPYILDMTKFTCQQQFNDKNLVFQSTNDDLVEYNTFYYAYLDKSPIYIFDSFFSWIFITREFFDRIREEKHLEFNNIEKIYKRIQLFEMIINSGIEIHMFSDFDNIFNSLRAYPTDFFGTEIKLNKSLQLEYCKIISKAIKSNKNIKVYSSYNLRVLESINIYNTNIISTKENFFVKKNIYAVNKLDNRFGYMKSSHYSNYIYNGVKNIVDSYKLLPLNDIRFFDNCLMYF